MHKRKRRNNKWSKSNKRYGAYFDRKMEQMRLEQYKQYIEYIKRIEKLKKDVKALGDIPQKEKQLIKTLQHFTDLINLATNFADKGVFDCIPIDEKKEKIKEFNDTIIALTCRSEEIPTIENRAPIGGKVTVDNLRMGIMSKRKEDVIPFSNQVIKNGTVYYVEVEPVPIADWINSKVKTVTGGKAGIIKQKALAELEKNMTNTLLENIEAVLE